MKYSKLLGCRRWSAAALSLLIGSPALAATFNPTSALELQAALNSAETNGQDDVIQIPAGTFLAEDGGESSFYYSSSENNGLTIQGAGAGSTLLTRDPDSSGNVLELYDNSSGEAANISVSGLTLEGGSSYGLQVFNGQANVSVQDNEFLNNYYGIYLNGNSPEVSVTGNYFSGNNYGLYGSSSNGSITATNNVFDGNVGSGYPVYLSSGGDLSIDLEQNTFQGNASNSSTGAVYLSLNTGPARLVGNSFLNNSSSSSAGAIYSSGGSSVALIDNLVAGNATSSSGSAIYVSSAESLLLVNNTVTDNHSSGYAGGLLVYPDSVSAPTELYNNIIFGNSSGPFGYADDVQIYDDFSNVGSPVTLSHNDIGDFNSDCRDDSSGACDADITQSGNLSSDPLFLDAGAGNFNLASGSPAIGAGDASAPQLPATDITGRNLNNPPDVGAFAAIAGLVVSPLSLNFGNTDIDVGDTQIVTLTNDGAVEVSVSALTLSDNDNYALDTADCGATPVLAPGDSCDLGLSFEPGAAGTFNATLSVDSNDSDEPSIVVQLSGIGIDGGGDNGDGGCSLGAASPASVYAAWILLPLLWGLRRFRR